MKLWLFGIYGIVGSTAIVGERAIRRGLSDTTGLVSELSYFKKLKDFAPLKFDFGGHDIRSLDKNLYQITEEHWELNHHFDRRILEQLKGDLENIKAKKGTAINCGEGVLEDLKPVNTLEEEGFTLREIVERLEEDIGNFADEDTVAINVASTEPLLPFDPEYHSTLEGFEKAFEQVPETLTADAGYGSEENYQALGDKEIEAFVKYNYFHKEQRQAKALVDKDPFHPDKLHYNQQTDTYYCPMGQPMNYIGERQRETTTGYLQTYNRYQALNCQGCPLTGVCHQSKSNRIIERNHKLITYKKQVKERLLSEQGIAHRKRRCWEVEAVFGNIKHSILEHDE